MSDASTPDRSERVTPVDADRPPQRDSALDGTGSDHLASPDPDPADTPALDHGGVQPGDTPPASSQAGGVTHQEAPPASGISWGFVIAIVFIVVLIGGGAIAAAISYL